MTQAEWRQVERLFELALTQEPAQRAAFLEQACAGDAGLRREVQSLLAQEEQAEHFLDEPACAVAAPASEPPQEQLPPGTRAGPYRILRQIGSGGMGAVYEAARADDQFQKRVAIKVVKRGTNSTLVLRRFRRERQILAGLNHPNIAALLDGGATADGLPYLVMEYVEGSPITEYCNARGLSVEQRLELFRAVCSAVHYAHQNLVVHRDLKPGNILVTPAGVPKLLDFGIAKLLPPDPTSAVTETVATMRPMTPVYASPEQIRGEPITTVSDVYSLGVLLYELLTGRLPYPLKTRSPEEVAAAICREQPRRPSTAAGGSSLPPAMRDLKGWAASDLDNIVLMALRKEPQRRYASVEQFSEDVRRHLAGLPVIAQKDTAAYRARKFVQRHKRGVFAAALLLLSLLAGAAGTAWQARVAERERARAQENFENTRRLASSLIFELHDGIAEVPGATRVRKLLVTRALTYLDSLARQSGNDVALLKELAEGYARIGEVEGAGYNPNIGDLPASATGFSKAAAIYRSILDRNPADQLSRQRLAGLWGSLALVQTEMGDSLAARESAQRALTEWQTLLRSDPSRLKTRHGLALAHLTFGEVLRSEDDGAALGHFETALEMLRQLEKIDPDGGRFRRPIAVALRKIGEHYQLRNDHSTAVSWFRQALEITSRRAETSPASLQTATDLSRDLETLGVSLGGQGASPEALRLLRRNVELRRRVAQADPKDAQSGFLLGQAHLVLGRQLSGDEALNELRRALALGERLVREQGGYRPGRELVARARFSIGQAHRKAGQPMLACAAWRAAATEFEDLRRLAPLSREYKDHESAAEAGRLLRAHCAQ